MDTIGQTINRPEVPVSALRKVGDGAAVPASEENVVGDTELTGA
jgi:hypothetical protein